MIVESYEDIIILSGDLSLNHWETIHTAISLTLRRHPSGVIADCSGLNTVTPEGAETFRDAMDFITHHDARIIMAAVPKAIMEVLRQIPDLRSQLPIASSVQEARTSLDLLAHSSDHRKQKKSTASQATRKIIVCLYVGTSVEEDNAAMRVASQIADSDPGQTVIHLLCTLVVSRELPLQAPMPEAEKSVEKAMGRAIQFFEDRGLTHFNRIERGRDVASVLSTVAEEISASMVIVPLQSATRNLDDNLKLVNSVLPKANVEVIFVRPTN